jgi:hypothetical protein
VSNQSPILRFGITCDGKRSSYWQVRAGMAKPELFLEHEGFGKVWHISLHASGEWHMVAWRKERATWDRPGELFPAIPGLWASSSPSPSLIGKVGASGRAARIGCA